MRDLILSSETLVKILLKLRRRQHGERVTVRDLERGHGIWKWETEQAAEMGWVSITETKPPRGRPAYVVELTEAALESLGMLSQGDDGAPKTANKSCQLIWPPGRHQIPKTNLRWSAFLHEWFMCWANATQAYMNVYKCRSRNGARASASRLMKRPEVQKELWEIRRQINGGAAR